MLRYRRMYLRSVLTAVSLFLCACTTHVAEPLFAAADLSLSEIPSIALLPVTFAAGHTPPAGIDLAREIEMRTAATLERKGYRVIRPGSAAGSAAAELAIHVDFLFLTETYSDVVPPAVIDIEAEGRLHRVGEGRLVWRDRGTGKVGGVGGERIIRPASALHLALTELVENLLDTLPDRR